MRTANPALSENTFRNFAAVQQSDAMTIEGTVHRTALLAGILVVTAAFSWQGASSLLLLGSVAGGSILALVTIFKKAWSPVTAPLYAICKGVALGTVSALYEARFHGIVLQAVLVTVGVLFGLLAAYRSGLIRATENFKLGVAAATLGIAGVYLVSLILNLFGKSVPYIHESGIVGIGFNLFVVVVAALNLVLDFDFIEKGAENHAPRYMEWYAAFGLLVTLVWLYLEVLRLLAKTRRRN